MTRDEAVQVAARELLAAMARGSYETGENWFPELDNPEIVDAYAALPALAPEPDPAVYAEAFEVLAECGRVRRRETPATYEGAAAAMERAISEREGWSGRWRTS